MNRALLIGINEYASDKISNLSGCLNDVKLVQEFLSGDKSPDFDIKVLTNQEATRHAVIHQIRHHLGQAESGDIAFLYFSGHGARQLSPAGIVGLQQDEKHENIVCHDSGYTDFFLADKELKYLLSELEENNGPEIVVVFDCCHSGSAIRNSSGNELTARQVQDWHQVREAETFLPGSLEAAGKIPGYRYMAACSPTEYAWEKPGGRDRERNGVFTRSLIDLLQSAAPGYFSYLDLADAIRHRIGWTLDNQVVQSPRLEITGTCSGNSAFLRHDFEHEGNSFLVSWDQKRNQWVVNVGVLHGFKPGSTATVQISKVAGGRDKVIGIAYVRKMGLFESPLEFPEDFPVAGLFRTAIYSGLLLAGEMRSLAVYDEAGILNPSDLVSVFPPESWPEEESATWSRKLKEEKLVTTEEFDVLIKVYNSPQGAPYTVVREEEGFQVLRTETREPLLAVPIPAASPESKTAFWQPLASILRHIARHEQVLILRNEMTSLWEEEDQMTFWLEERNHAKRNSFRHPSPFVTIDYEPGRPVPFQVKVVNSSVLTLHTVLLYLSAQFQVFQENPLELAPHGEEKILVDDQFSIHPGPDREIPHHDQDLYYLLCSKEAIPFVGLGSQKGLNELLKELKSGHSKGTGMRGVGGRHNLPDAWFVKKLIIKSLLTLGKIGHEVCQLPKHSLTLHAHPSFQAKVSVANLARHLFLSDADAWIRDAAYSRGNQLLDFTGYGDAQIELHHIEKPETVSEHAPLTIRYAGIIPAGIRAVAYTLPPDLENPAQQLVRLATWEPHPAGGYQLSLVSIPPNPTDHRSEPGKSLKIVTILES